VRQLQGSPPAAESRSSRIGPISIEAKQTGERSARKSACCVRRGGGWKRGRVESGGHSQTEGGDNRGHKLRPTPRRQSSTLPVRAEGCDSLPLLDSSIISRGRPTSPANHLARAILSRSQSRFSASTATCGGPAQAC